MDQASNPRIVILTGSGISKESGLHTFRDADGIWAKVSLEDVATPEAYARDPARVQDFYNARRRSLLAEDVHPNPAHQALAELERVLGEDVLLVTQNIDNLHERAGSRNVLHMHGELLKSRCTGCGAVFDCLEDLQAHTACPRCSSADNSGGRLRPHVVWFGEMPFEMDRVAAALAGCELFVAIGTSGVVYPAAGFVQTVRALDTAHTVELNLEPSARFSLFKEQIYGPASTVVPRFVRRILEGGP